MSPVVYRPPSKDIPFPPARRRRAYWWGAVAAFLCAALAVVYLRQYVVILGLNYDIAKHQRQLEEARRDCLSLRADLYRKRSINEIDEIARDQLHMRPPAPGQIILVEDK